MPDAILISCRMSLLIKHRRGRALCLYAGCHSFYMPDAFFALAKSRESALCLYAGCHSVYMPEVTFTEQRQ